MKIIITLVVLLHLVVAITAFTIFNYTEHTDDTYTVIDGNGTYVIVGVDNES